ncbi:MAG: GILT family protein [Nanoarchaeota archaeon]
MEKMNRLSKASQSSGLQVILMVSIVAMMLALSSCERFNVKLKDGQGATPTGSGSGDKVRFDLYVMSQCPYGVQAENLLKDVFEKIGDRVDFHLEFIGSGAASNLGSLHGENEVNGDIAQLCAVKYSPDKYFDMVLCMNENPSSIPGNWESCAAKTGVDAVQVKACYEGSEGKKLAEESFKRSEEAGAQGSPTFKIAGRDYNGKRDAKGVLSALCNGFEKDAPEACVNIPKPLEFEVLIVTSKDCKTCDTSNIEGGLSQIFEGAKFRKIDASDTAGKDAIQKHGLIRAPSFVFEKKVEETEEWKSTPQLAAAFDLKSDRWVLKDEATGASYFFDPAKQAEVEKATIAAKAAAMQKLGVNADEKPQIDFFVMSYCPYGNQAEEAILPVYDLLKGKADFNPHYVIYKDYQGGSEQFCNSDKLCSLHGIQELNQNVREMCVRKLYSQKEWFDFTIEMNSKCSSQNADTCWTDVAKSLKLDDKKIAECEKTQGLELVKAEYELNTLLEVQGSPTIFIEGLAFEGARSPAGYEAGLCSAYKTAPKECETKLAGETAAPASGAGGCGTA